MRIRTPRSLKRLSGVCTALLLTSLAAYAQEPADFDPIAADELLSEISFEMANPDVSAAFLTDARSRVVATGLQAQSCEQIASTSRARLETLYEPFRDITGDVDVQVFDQSLDIKRQLEDAIRVQTQCASLRDGAQQMVERITARQNALSQQFLFHRGDSVIGRLANLPSQIVGLKDVISEAPSLDLIDGISNILLFWMLIGGGALAVVFSFYLRHSFQKQYAAADFEATAPPPRYLFFKPLSDNAPLIIEGITLTAILYAAVSTPSLDMMVIRLAAGISIFGLGRTIIGWATGVESPSASLKGMFPEQIVVFRRRLTLLLLILVASFVVLGTRWLAIRSFSTDITEGAAMGFLVAVGLVSVINFLGTVPGLHGRYRLIRYSALLALIGGIFVLLIGYQNLAGFIIHGVTRTALSLFLLWLSLWAVLSLFSYLNQQDAPSAVRIRRNLGITESSKRTGLGFMQLVTDLFIWLTVVVFLIYVWDYSGTTIEALIVKMRDGFQIGAIKLEPINIIRGILIFVAMIVVIGWIKQWIDRRWLQQIIIERGAREAIVTVFGYVGFLLAVLVALTQAGVDLGGLAIVSGAFALGIGFGMQEIASNLVSGLILLFERPIRTGDFVSVGDTEGFVRSIRIRATEIETMDNQNVLVPNSELVSGRVINWVLRDTAGRLQISVGVAYGSDVEKVRDILVAVSSEHPEVITDGSAPAPRALFMGFGDSSLDFELRVRIPRIERRFSVQSDINFAIDAAFREAGITIPFPQRDLHVVSFPDRDQPKETTEEAQEEVAKEETVLTRVVPPQDTITRSHVESVELAATVTDVWAAMTDIDLLKKWLIMDGEFSARIGGRFAIQMRDGSEQSGRIDIYMPNRRLRMVLDMRDGEEPLSTGPITVEQRLLETEKGTELIVTVGGIPADEDWEEDYRRSVVRWQIGLEELKSEIRDSA